MEYELKVNGKVVAVFENYQNAVVVARELLTVNIFLSIRVNNLPIFRLNFNESKTTFKQFSGV